VLFGDGVNGARAATGFDNIRAVYRKGIGTSGNVDANQLTLMQTRPQGVRSVSNPLPASGGADPETADGIRRNAPLAILTMDRIVSLQDYEDFAQAFGGIGKALATTWTWTGHGRGVFITVAGPDGAAIDPGSRTYTNLLAAIEKAGAPHVPLHVEPYRKAFFQVTATVMVAPDYQTDRVVAAVEAALRSKFSFDARAFGQPVALSEVVAVMQAVPGVVAIDIDRLGRTDDLGGDGLLQPLSAASPQMGDDNALLAAELLILDPRPVDLKGVMA
jgi:predicted phage baseplate assembly protein